MNNKESVELVQLIVDICVALRSGDVSSVADQAKEFERRGRDLLKRLDVQAAGPTAMLSSAVAALKERHGYPGTPDGMPAVLDCCAWIEGGRRDRQFMAWIALAAPDLETVDQSLWRRRIEQELQSMGVRSDDVLSCEPIVLFGTVKSITDLINRFCPNEQQKPRTT